MFWGRWAPTRREGGQAELTSMASGPRLKTGKEKEHHSLRPHPKKCPLYYHGHRFSLAPWTAHRTKVRNEAAQCRVRTWPLESGHLGWSPERV